MDEHDGVEGNARLTGVVGALLLIALAVEGVTVVDVSAMFALHVFIGLFVVPIVALKTATTGYRFFHYYKGTAAYRRKGPPHPILRIAAPFVVASTVSLLATGIIALAVGPRHSDTWLNVHTASFIVWFIVMTAHVVGHALETWKLTTAEICATPPTPRRVARVAIVTASLALGLGLGIASLEWTKAWDGRGGERDGTPSEFDLAQHRHTA